MHYFVAIAHTSVFGLKKYFAIKKWAWDFYSRRNLKDKLSNNNKYLTQVNKDTQESLDYGLRYHQGKLKQ